MSALQKCSAAPVQASLVDRTAWRRISMINGHQAAQNAEAGISPMSLSWLWRRFQQRRGHIDPGSHTAPAVTATAVAFQRPVKTAPRSSGIV